MSVDLARVILESDTRGLKKGEVAMNRFASTGELTERRVKKSSVAMSGAINAVGASAVRMAAVAGAALGAFMGGKLFIGAIREQEQLQRNMLKTQSIIEATGGAAGKSADQLLNDARAIARATLQSTEGIMAAQQVMLTFRSITGETFDAAITAATDMSEALGTNLNSAILQIGKALEDPVTGMTALTRSGTVFTQSQKDMVKAMVEAGNAAGAQAFILGELERQYGGVARAAAGGLAGVMDTLGQSFQEFQIALADSLGLGDTASSLIGGLARGLDYLTENIDGVTSGLKVLIFPLKLVGGLIIGMAVAVTKATVAMGNAINAITDYFNGTVGGQTKLQIATDNATLAMADEIVQTQTLSKVLETSTRMSESAARVKLSEAKARYENVAAIIAENRNNAIGSAGFLELTQQIERRSNALDAGSRSAIAAPAREEAQQALAALINQRDLLLQADEKWASNLKLTAENIGILETALQNVVGGYVNTNGEVVNAIDLGNRLAVTAATTSAAVTDTGDAVVTLGDKLKSLGKDALTKVGAAFSDFFNRGFKDFGSFAKSILKTFGQMLLQMVWMAAKNKIMLNISGGGAGGGGGFLGKLIGGAAGIGAFATPAIAAAGGTAAVAATAGTGLMGGLGASLGVGGAVGGGIFGVGASAAAAGGTLMATIGAALPIIGIGLAIFGLFKMFKKKPPITQKDFRIIQTGLQLTGMELLGTGHAGQVAAASLKKLFGGVKNFTKITESYYSNFFTNEEKRQRAIEGISGVFDRMGLAMPATAEEFRGLVEAQDLTTSAGQKTYASLLKVSDAFAAVYGGVNDTTKALVTLSSMFGGDIFSTLVDQKRALAYQNSGTDYLTARPESVGQGLAYRGAGPRMIDRKSYEAEATAAKQADEIAAQTKLLQGIMMDNKKLLRLQQQWEGIGMPATRV